MRKRLRAVLEKEQASYVNIFRHEAKTKLGRELTSREATSFDKTLHSQMLQLCGVSRIEGGIVDVGRMGGTVEKAFTIAMQSLTKDAKQRLPPRTDLTDASEVDIAKWTPVFLSVVGKLMAQSDDGNLRNSIAKLGVSWKKRRAMRGTRRYTSFEPSFDHPEHLMERLRKEGVAMGILPASEDMERYVYFAEPVLRQSFQARVTGTVATAASRRTRGRGEEATMPDSDDDESFIARRVGKKRVRRGKEETSPKRRKQGKSSDVTEVPRRSTRHRKETHKKSEKSNLDFLSSSEENSGGNRDSDEDYSDEDYESS